MGSTADTFRRLSAPTIADSYQRMSRVQIKRAIINLLRESDLALIEQELSRFPENHLLNALFSCLCHPEELVRWHAVSGFGCVLPTIGERDMEAARTVMRRFLWMLNDESGGIGWGVPEAMGEVMYHCRPLAEEYLHMLVSYTIDDGPELFQDGNFLEMEMLQEGVLWGLCRVAPRCREPLLSHKIDDHLKTYFQAASGPVRGLACRLSGCLGLKKCRALLVGALADHTPFRYYQEGEFLTSDVAFQARQALDRL